VTIISKNIKASEGAEAPAIEAKRLIIIDPSGANHPTGGTIGTPTVDGIEAIETKVEVLAIGKVIADGKPFGDVVIKNDGNLMVGGEDDTGIAAGALHLSVEGTLTLNKPIVTEAEGDAIVLVTERLINRVGPDALQTPNGRSLVYSVNPRIDVTNGIPAKVVYKASIETAPPEAVPDTGNVIFYENSETPELTMVELNVVTDPIDLPQSDLAPSESVTLAAPSPTVFTIPAALDSAGSQDLLFSNDGNYQLWGLSGTQ
jgi:hypothetical protein